MEEEEDTKVLSREGACPYHRDSKINKHLRNEHIISIYLDNTFITNLVRLYFLQDFCNLYINIINLLFGNFLSARATPETLAVVCGKA